MTLLKFILLAHGLVATTFGWGEGNCGDIGKPRPCEKGAITASGEMFDPDLPIAAVPAPTNLIMRAQWIYLRTEHGECQRIRLSDKSNPRWIGKRGFDLSPAAVKLLTGQEPTKHWSAKVYVCQKKKLQESFQSWWELLYGRYLYSTPVHLTLSKFQLVLPYSKNGSETHEMRVGYQYHPYNSQTLLSYMWSPIRGTERLGFCISPHQGPFFRRRVFINP